MDSLSHGKRTAVLQSMSYLEPQEANKFVRVLKFCGRALGFTLYWVGRGLMWIGKSLQKVSEKTP